MQGTGRAQDLTRDILIVHGDGSETKLLARYVPTW